MMVPRAFTNTSIGHSKSREVDEKDVVRRRSSRQEVDARPRRRSSNPSLTTTTSKSESNGASLPVRIPSQKARRPDAAPVQRPSQASAARVQTDPGKRETPHDILSATAIPVRRRPKGRAAQRLPHGDHVADFSRLLLGDLSSKSEGSLSGSLNNPHFDGLFGNIDELVEEQMFVGSEGVDATILSTRSVSSESMPSLASPDDFMSSDIGNSPLLGRKSPSDRRLRQLASSEDCGPDHPLQSPVEENDESMLSLPETASPALRSKRQAVSPKPSSSFKSSLSASLRALKYAAESISNNLAASNSASIQPDEFAIFAIQPSMTDDKRPPPSSEPPSPALRRYLNPLPPGTHPDSPVHLHFWHDDRHSTPPSPSPTTSTLKIKKKYKKSKDASGSILPPVVPLQSCIPSTIRTAHASSPPIWLAPDGTPSNKNTAQNNGGVPLLLEPGQPRQREPRENRDFLRVLVAEMNMRKAGKLDGGDGVDGMFGGGRHAKAMLWLPPVKEDFNGPARKAGEERWRSWGVDDLQM